MFQKGELIFLQQLRRVPRGGSGAAGGGAGADRERSYYKLSLLHGGGTIFAPVNSQVFMRPILSAEAANALIDTLLHSGVRLERAGRALPVRPLP